MLTYLDSGEIIIDDFPDGEVTVRPPRFGAMKRLRAERARLARAGETQIAAWDAEHPTGDDDEPEVRARRATDRLLAVEAINLDAAAEWWKLVLLGDDSFAGLADGKVPADTDDWPASLIYDFRPILKADAPVEAVLEAQPLVDQVFRHWGKGRSRSGATNGQMAPSLL